MYKKTVIRLLAAGMVSFFTVKIFAQTQNHWQMQPVVLKTRWSQDVKADKPLNEYPRPQLERKNWTNLNGLWKYAIADSTAKPTIYDGEILVPYPLESALSGIKTSLLPDQRLWYKRSFSKPNLKTGERTKLNFGAVDYQCWVYVNGKEVGTHEGGYTAFSFDITDALKDGNNELVVKVYDPTNAGIGPHGKQVLNPGSIYYTPSSGIWQTVWLETVPANYIENLIINPDVDQSSVSITVTAKENKPVSINVHGRPIQGNANQPINISLEKSSLRLWSPENPYLYEFTVKMGDDAVKSYFGMRKVEIKKADDGYDRIFLNNEPYFNLGTLDQGFWPDGLYTAPTDEALKFDIEAIKAMGFNTIRKHIKVEPARWYYYADKMGMLVWQDMVNPNQGLPPGAKTAFEQQSKEILNQLHNYPSITTWVLFNERWGAYDQKRLTEWVKQTDPSRLVNGHSGELLYVNQQLRAPSDNPYVSSDLVDYHSYPDPMEIKPIVGKASVIGEFGGIGVPVPEHQWDDLTGWGYVQVTPKQLIGKYDIMVRRLKKLEAEGLSASIYTQPFDVEGEENGLLTYDREIIKIPVEKLREIHASLNPGLSVQTPFMASQPLAKNIDTEDTDDRYPELLQAFKNGKRDSAFLRRLNLMAIRKKDKQGAAEISAAYIGQLKDPFTSGNLNFIRKTTLNPSDAGFEFLRKNAVKVNAAFGPNNAEMAVMDMISAAEITPYVQDKTVKPDWEGIGKRVISKYGNLGNERMLMEQTLYYWLTVPNTDSLAKYYTAYYKIALKRSKLNINNISWAVFEKVKDVEVLKFAADVAKYNMENFDQTADAYDTYANLLYKSGGDKEEAIRWEEKALAMDPNSDWKKEALGKMKAGEKTWKDE